MLRPVCVGCSVEMRCVLNGALVRTSVGHLRAGDAYACPQCGVQIVTGFSIQSVPDEVALRISPSREIVADLTATRGE